MVMLYHWLPSFIFFREWNIGPLGVSVFFVLSGFLITRILIIQKEKIINGICSARKVLVNFFLKRSLRIFPIYYLLVFFLFALNFESVREEAFWHLSYTSNVLYMFNGEFSNGVAHFWSLSVEEQFYIIWAPLLLIVPRKRLEGSFIISIILGASAFILFSMSIPKSNLLVFARIDGFAWGSLLAYFYHSRKDLFNAIVNYSWIGFIILGVFISSHFFHVGVLGWLKNTLFYASIFFFIAILVKEKYNWTRIIFGNKYLRYLGKISYGIYLYHNLMQWLLPYFLKELGIPFLDASNELGRFIVYFLMTIIVASISWYTIEKPLLSLKKRLN